MVLPARQVHGLVIAAGAMWLLSVYDAAMVAEYRRRDR